MQAKKESIDDMMGDPRTAQSSCSSCHISLNQGNLITVHDKCEGGIEGLRGGRRSSMIRWTPRREQVDYLRYLFYEEGIRSPSSEQISQIACFLRRFGRIQGRNVFYWFQNQKARERKRMKTVMITLGAMSAPLNLPMEVNTQAPREVIACYGRHGAPSSPTMNGLALHTCSHMGTPPYNYSFHHQEDYSTFFQEMSAYSSTSVSDGSTHPRSMPIYAPIHHPKQQKNEDCNGEEEDDDDEEDEEINIKSQWIDFFALANSNGLQNEIDSLSSSSYETCPPLTLSLF